MYNSPSIHIKGTQMKKALFAGSFDPITNGHLWLIEKSSTLFDELVVVIGTNADKKYMFSAIERISMVKEALKPFKNISIVNLENDLIVDYAAKIGAKYLVRGIRNSKDFEFEKTVTQVNNDINSDIQTVHLIPPRNYLEISSSLVKGLINSKNWEKIVAQYVPANVLTTLKIKVEYVKIL